MVAESTAFWCFTSGFNKNATQSPEPSQSPGSTDSGQREAIKAQSRVPIFAWRLGPGPGEKKRGPLKWSP